MSPTNETFRKLEFLNVKMDIWIDEEEYNKVYRCVEVASDKLKKVFTEKSKQEILKHILQRSLTKTPDLSVRFDPESKEEPFSVKGNSPWKPLLFAKWLRAKIMEKGKDDYSKLLDDLTLYLQRNLPLQYAKLNETKIALLRHIYFQELSACGRPGLESLGYAIRAYHLICDLSDGTNNSWQNDHFNFQFYKLWARLNQGIGYWHSGQKPQAASAFDEIIHKLDSNHLTSPSDEEANLARALILDQAVIFKAELNEDRQFSYHALETLQRLGNRKKERRLIKEALAYRDMGRLREAKLRIRELLGCKHRRSADGIFKAFENWTVGNQKPVIWSQTIGLLFDFFLEELNQNVPTDSNEKGIPHSVSSLTKWFITFLENKKITDNKPDRVSYYQQLARYLEWLADSGDRYRSEIGSLYKVIARDFPWIRGNRSKERTTSCRGVRLDDFNKYEYDRFTRSMEEFYNMVNVLDKSASEPFKPDDEIDFLRELNRFEERKKWLYRFKKHDREARIKDLEKETNPCNSNSRKCFHRASFENALGGLLGCVKRQSYANDAKPLLAPDYEHIMRTENERFLEYLKNRSRHPKSPTGNSSYHFLGLQRWNSQTPTLTLSQGGGYFLYQQDSNGNTQLGIAIDPGFDFVDNLFHMGFTLSDIDFILITHAHLDHMRDFEPIVSSLFDLEKRTSKTMQNSRQAKKIHVMMSLGVYQKLKNVITNAILREYLADTYIIDIDKDVEGSNREYLRTFKFARNNHQFVSLPPSENTQYEFAVTATFAYHNDFSDCSDSFGYIIEFRNVQPADRTTSGPFSFGYTGDTKWHPSIPSQYAQCDAICIHLGALIESEKTGKDKFDHYKGPECEALLRKKGHPYLFGLLRFLRMLCDFENRNRLILISEFGEELKGGIRLDLTHRLNQLICGSLPASCIPVDIGLNVQLVGNESAFRIWCFGCERFVTVENIRYKHFAFGRDEALFYFCHTCLRSKPDNFIQEKMRSIAEFGLPLRKEYEPSN